MTKTLTYSGFVMAGLLIILIFVTATAYSQLVFAAVLYSVLIFVALKIFPHIDWSSAKTAILPPLKFNHALAQTAKPKTQPLYIADIDKRTFIKFIAATGISFFLFSLVGRRLQDLVFGNNGGSGITPSNTNGNQFGLAGSSPTDGYKIAEISEGAITYYGFISQDGAWLIMRQDTNENSFRYAKDGSNFPANWTNRENLKYDYFYNLF